MGGASCNTLSVVVRGRVRIVQSGIAISIHFYHYNHFFMNLLIITAAFGTFSIIMISFIDCVNIT